MAYDKAGRSSSASVSVTIDNTAPAITMTSPGNGWARGVLSLAADASDAQGVVRVEFSVDGTLLATHTTAPYSATWDTTGISAGHDPPHHRGLETPRRPRRAQRRRLRDWLAQREHRAPERPPSRLVVLAGPTAVGKGAVSTYIREHHPSVLLSVRPPPGHHAPVRWTGCNYYFVDDAEFDR